VSGPGSRIRGSRLSGDMRTVHAPVGLTREHRAPYGEAFEGPGYTCPGDTGPGEGHRVERALALVMQFFA